MVVVAKDLDDYRHFFDTTLRRLLGVTNIRSNLSLREMKASSKLPISMVFPRTASGSQDAGRNDRLEILDLQVIALEQFLGAGLDHRVVKVALLKMARSAQVFPKTSDDQFIVRAVHFTGQGSAKMAG